MIILGVDCSHSSGSICLQNNSDILCYKEWRQEKSHAETITQTIYQALKDSSLTLEQLNYLSVIDGPGSFTGLRIAINTVKTISFAKNIPIFNFNSLEVLAHSVKDTSKKLLVLLNAHTHLCYCAEFEYTTRWKIIENIKVVPASEVSNLYNLNDYHCIGDAIDIYQLKNISKPNTQLEYTNALCLNDLLINTYNERTPISWTHLQPFYVRLSSPEEKVLDQGQRRK